MGQGAKFALIVLGTAGLAYAVYVILNKKMGVAGAPSKPPAPQPSYAPNNESAPVANNNPSPAPSGANFPIKMGSKGSYVKSIQSAIGVTADGIFGSQTEAALVAKTGKNSVDNLDEYNALVFPLIYTGSSAPASNTDAAKQMTMSSFLGLMGVTNATS